MNWFLTKDKLILYTWFSSAISYPILKHYTAEIYFWFNLIVGIIAGVWLMHRVYLWYRRKGYFSILNKFFK